MLSIWLIGSINCVAPVVTIDAAVYYFYVRTTSSFFSYSIAKILSLDDIKPAIFSMKFGTESTDCVYTAIYLTKKVSKLKMKIMFLLKFNTHE